MDFKNTTFYGQARDTLLSNQDTEKLNFDTNHITKYLYAYGGSVVFQGLFQRERER